MAVTYGAKSDAAERERWPERPPKKLTALSFSADMTLILSCDEIREKQSPSSIKPLPLSISRGLISWDANVFVVLACHYLVGTRWVQSTIKLLDCPRSLSSAAVGTSQQHQNFKNCWTPRIKSRMAGWEAQTQTLCPMPFPRRCQCLNAFILLELRQCRLVNTVA